MLADMRSALFCALLVATACGHGASGPVLLVSHPAELQAWTTVSLTVSGTEANDKKRRACMEEAHTAGIQLAAGAPISGTLYFLKRDDYVEGTDVPRYVLGATGANATCKIALGKLTKIDAIVPMMKADPTGCRAVGAFEGSDFAMFHAGSFAAAVIEAQFKVRAAGGNRFVADVTQQQGQRVVVNGRGFACPPPEMQLPAQQPVQ